MLLCRIRSRPRSDAFAWSFSCLLVLFLGLCSSCSEEPDTTAPQVRITVPVAGVVLSGITSIQVSARDEGGIDRVEIYVDESERIAVDSEAPYGTAWEVHHWADGFAHTITAHAYDHAGNRGESPAVTVTIPTSAQVTPLLLAPDIGQYVHPDSMDISWLAFPNAVEYTIQISRTESFAEPEFATTSTSTSVHAVFAFRGRCYWRVKASTPDKGDTDWSRVRDFHNLHVFTHHLVRQENQFGYTACPITDGGYVVAGGPEFPQRGSAWLMKVDGAGTPSWSQEYAWGNRNLITHIIETDDGMALFGYTSHEEFGDLDIWFILADDAGNELWSSRYGGAADDWCSSAIRSADGGYILAGTTGISGEDAENVLVAKLDEGGDQVWSRTFGGSESDFGNCIVPTNDGGYAVVGGTMSNSLGNGSAWLIRFSANNAVLWTSVLGSRTYCWGVGAAALADGGFVITGHASDTDEWTTNDIFLIRTDNTGQVLWESSLGRPGWDWAKSVCVWNDGGFGLVGGIKKQSSDYDLLLVHTDEDGNEIFRRSLGGAGYDCGRTVIPVPGDGYLISGTFTDPEDGTGADIWILHVDDFGNMSYDASGKQAAHAVLRGTAAGPGSFRTTDVRY